MDAQEPELLQENQVRYDMRRVVLMAAGLATYELGDRFRLRPSITCCCCGMRSFNPIDISQKYCGNCHQFHDAALEGLGKL